MPAEMTTSRYGAVAYEVLANLVGLAKVDDAMANVTVIVPDNMAGLSVRRRLAAGVCGRRGVAVVDVTTLVRFAESVASPFLDTRPATRPMISAAWRAALAEEPGTLRPVANHPATIRALMRVHQELRHLDVATLDVIEQSDTLAGEVTHLFRQVRGRLRDFHDDQDLLRSAIDLVADRPEVIAKAGTVIVFLPQRLSLRERRLLEVIAAHSPMHVVVGRTGSLRADAVVLEVAEALCGPQTTLAFDEPSAAAISHASDSDDEIRSVARSVVDKLRFQPGHRLAILYGPAEPYARLLHDHLSAAGVQINGPGVQSLVERPHARALLSLLALPGLDFARASFFDALSAAPFQLNVENYVPVARWERVSRSAGVVRGDDWRERLDAFIQDASETIAVLEATNDDEVPERRARALRFDRDTAIELRDFVAELMALFGAGARLTSWRALAEWMTKLFERCFGTFESFDTQRPDQRFAVASIEGVLRSISELDAIGGPVNFDTLVDVLAAELEAARQNVGRFGEGIYVGPITAAPGLDVDELHVVGLAEDTYPGRLTPDPILPDSVRALTGGGMPLQRSMIDDRLRHLLAAFETRTAASFARGDLRSSRSRLPSRWLLPSFSALAGTTVDSETWERVDSVNIEAGRSHWNSLRTTEMPATAQEWRVRRLAAGQTIPLDPARDAALELIVARESRIFTRFDGNLSTVDGLPNYATSGDSIAPTRLESYATCPHAFFVERVLRVQPIEAPEEIIVIRPMDIGTLVHRIVDRLVVESPTLPGFGEPWTADHRERVHRIAEEEATRAAERGLTGHPLLWRRELASILEDLDTMLDDDSRERARTGAKVAASELRFGSDGIDPVAVEVAQGVVHLAGSADKVDLTEDGLVYVTDVKTGKAEKFKSIEAGDPVVKGTKLQLPAYALAAARAYDAVGVRAGYWFVRRDRGTRVTVALNENTLTRYAEAVGTLTAGIAGGLFPPRPPMEPDRVYVTCPYCNFDGVGHSELREAYERKRGDGVLAELMALIDPPDPDEEMED